MAYQNMLRLSVYCNGVYSQSASLTVAQEDFRLFVHITSSPLTKGGNQTGLIQNSFQGALTDNSVLSKSEETKCKKLLCKPVWLVPLPIYDDRIHMKIAIEESPRVLYSAPLREYLLINPFYNGAYLFGKTVGLSQEIANLLTSKGAQTIESTTGVSVMDVLVVGKNYVLVSDDSWSTVTPVQVIIPDSLAKVADVCEDSKAQDVYVIATASPGVQIFFATNVGLITMSFDHRGNMNTRSALQKCVRKLEVPSPYSASKELLLVFVEDGQGHISLYFARQDRQNEGKLGEDSILELIDLTGHCEPKDGCTIVDAEFDGSEKDCIIILTKESQGSPGDSKYNVLKYHTDDHGGNDFKVLIKFEGYLIKSQYSADFYSLLTTELKTEMELFEAGNLTPDSSLPCDECYKKVAVNIDKLISHPLSSNNIVLTGSHVLQGVVGGRLHCLSDVAEDYDFQLVATDQTGLTVAYTPKPTKRLYLWLLNSHKMYQLYPSHGWDMVIEKHDSESGAVADPIPGSEVISLKFGIDGTLILLLAEAHVSKPNQTLLRMVIDATAVIKFDQMDKHSADGSLTAGESIGSVCNYDVKFDNEHLLAHTSTQNYDWHMFPISRASHTYRHSLSNIVTNQLIVYNYMTGSMKWMDTSEKGSLAVNSSGSYSHPVSVITQKDDQLAYSFGVRRSHSGESHQVHQPHVRTSTLPKLIYLDTYSSTNFTVYISLLNDKDGQTGASERNSSQRLELDDIDISLEFSSHSNELILVEATKKTDYYKNTAMFEVNMTANRNTSLEQDLPGHNLLPVSLTIRIPHAKLQCAKLQPEAGAYSLDGLHSMEMMIGCPPQQVPYFDQNRTIMDLEFQQERHLNCLYRDGPEYTNCFYFQHTFYPHFSILDTVSGKSRPFTGKYTLKVIGGGTRFSKINRFSESQIRMYNTFNQSAREMDYIMIAPEKYYPRQSHSGYPVYSDEDNAVIWHCDTKSPCAHPPPAEWGIPEYFFLLEFSNKDVDDTTSCKFELTFLVTAFGYKIGQQDYAILMATLIALVTHIICYYFWKTRYYWLAKLHQKKDNVAVKKLLSLGKLATIASQASLKKQLLEAIYNDDTLMLSDALTKAETGKKDDTSQDEVNKMVLSMAKDKLLENMRKRLEKQIADHDIKGLGFTLGELSRMNFIGEVDHVMMSKAKKILSKKANVVLKLIEAMQGESYIELAECLTRYKEMMRDETMDNNSLIRQATVQLTSILTKQLLKSLKKKDTWDIHYAIKEFKNHKIVDKFNLLPKAEQVIYYRLTGKLRKAIKQGTPQLLRDAILCTEKDLDFHNIKDRDGTLNEAKSLLYKILKDKLAEELKRRDSMKIRNAINRFAFYGVSDASGFLEKANKNLYNLVIPPIAKALDTAKTPDEIHKVVTRIRAELNRYGLQDKDSVASKAEKMLYDAIAKQLQNAIKVKSQPKDLAIILSAFIMSKKQYNITQDLRKLEETAKTLLYRQLIPFMLKILKGPPYDIQQLSASIVAAKIEFSRIGIEDPGDLIHMAEEKLYDLTFGPLREAVQYSRDSKTLWNRMKSAQTALREHGIVDRENLLLRAESRFAELISIETDEGAQRKDIQTLKNMREFLKLVSHPHKLEFLTMIDKNIKDVSAKLTNMNSFLQTHTTEFKNLCEELKYATDELQVTGDIQAIMPVIIKFETSGFPDNVGVQKAALVAVADIVDAEFKKYMTEQNYAKIALLRDVVNTAAMEPRIKDLYYLLTVICGKFITIRADIEIAIADKSLELSKHLRSLDTTLKSLRSLKPALPAYYTAPVQKLEDKMRELMAKAEENVAFLTSIEEIRSDLTHMNPVDIIQLDKYTIVPAAVFDILRAFLTILGRQRTETERWMDIRAEISTYTLIAGLLSEAQNYTLGSTDMLELLDARDYCEPHLGHINVTEESSAEQTTLAVLLKWVLLVINESTMHFNELRGDLHTVVARFKKHKAVSKEQSVSAEAKKDSMVHGKPINAKDALLIKELISCCQDILRPVWKAPYLARWVQGFPDAGESCIHLRHMIEFKQSLKLFNLYFRYAPQEPLMKYGSIIEYTGTDKNGKPVFLCQFGNIDFEGMVKSFLPCQVILHFLYLMEMVEHICKDTGYDSILIIDCGPLQQVAPLLKSEALNWFHTMHTIMKRIYPGLFKMIYVLHGSKYKKATDAHNIPLFESSPEFKSVFLEGDNCKEKIYTLVDKQYLPQSLGGSYNINGHLNSPAKIPTSYYLLEQERHSRDHWLSLTLDAGQPKTLTYVQEHKTADALLFCEFEPDCAIDFEITFTPQGLKKILPTKKTIVQLTKIDHLYCNHIDASQAGTYRIIFTHHQSWYKQSVRYEAGLANTVAEIREYVFKLGTDEEGNLIDIIGPALTRPTDHK